MLTITSFLLALLAALCHTIYSTLKNKYWTSGAIGSSTLASGTLQRLDYFWNCGYAPLEKYFITANSKLAMPTC